MVFFRVPFVIGITSFHHFTSSHQSLQSPMLDLSSVGHHSWCHPLRRHRSPYWRTEITCKLVWTKFADVSDRFKSMKRQRGWDCASSTITWLSLSVGGPIHVVHCWPVRTASRRRALKAEHMLRWRAFDARARTRTEVCVLNADRSTWGLRSCFRPLLHVKLEV